MIYNRVKVQRCLSAGDAELPRGIRELDIVTLDTIAYWNYDNIVHTIDLIRNALSCTANLKITKICQQFVNSVLSGPLKRFTKVSYKRLLFRDNVWYYHKIASPKMPRWSTVSLGHAVSLAERQYRSKL